jgi:AraC-like DNA-binding protein
VAEPLPLVRADLTAADPATQVAFWQGVAPGAYAVRADPRPTTPLDVTTTVRRVDDLMLTRFKARAHVIARPREQVGRSSAPYLKLRLYRRGGTRLLQGDGTTLHRLGPGAVHLIDQSRPWIAEHGDHEQLSLFATHAAVGYDPSRFAACESLPLDQPLGRMLADVLRAFARRADEVSVADAPALARGLTGAVRGLLEGGGTSEADVDIRTARRAAMRRYIEAHLGDPELGIDRRCGAFGAARATIYRDFACAGGVERYIVQRRLARAFEFLSHHRGARGVVRAVAERYGFSSTSHFSHAFTQRFGMRPAHAVGLAAAPGPGAAAPEPPLPEGLEALRARLAALYASFTGG